MSKPRSRLDRIFGGPVPEEPAVDEVALAERRQVKAEEVAANLYENLNSQLWRTQHELSELRGAYELLAEENETLRRRVQELDRLAFPTMPLPDALQAELLLDLTDQPAAPKSPVTFPDPVEWVDVVTPSTNGTAT